VKKMDNSLKRDRSKIISCPICLGKSSIFTKIKEFDIYRCDLCGHGFIYPAVLLNQLRDIYDTEESEISNSDSFSLLQAYLDNPKDIHRYYMAQLKLCQGIIKRIGIHNPRILEVGCSCGVFLRCLKDLGYASAQGIDINPKAAEVGKNKLSVDIYPASIENFDAKEKFDLILAFAVLEHLINPKASLAVLKEHLNENGEILFIVPNFNSLIRHIMGKRWIWYMPQAHLHYFTVNSAQRMAKAQGLKIANLTTGNIGTYLYLFYYFFFGLSEKKNKKNTSKANISYGTFRRLDEIVRFFLSPFILISMFFKGEPHIIGVLNKQS